MMSVTFNVRTRIGNRFRCTGWTCSRNAFTVSYLLSLCLCIAIYPDLLPQHLSLPSVQLWNGFLHHHDRLMSTAQLLRGLCLWSVAHSLTCGFPGMCHSYKCPPNIQLYHCMRWVLPGLALVWHSQTRARKRERVWYHTYTSSVPVESAECNTYDVNFIMRVLTKI